MAYEHMVDKLSGKVDRTRSDVKKIAVMISTQAAESVPNQVEGSPTPTPTPTPSPTHSSIPLHPRREDYEKVQHWDGKAWNAIRHPKKGSKAERGANPKNVLFWEDENGDVIPPDERKVITQDARAIWQEMHDKGKRLDSLTNLGWDVRDNFRARMEEAHPWLRLCRDHWKADQIWSNHFSGWSPAGDEANTGSLSPKRERSVEEGEAGPSSKKIKTTAAEPVKRPQPTKKAVAKVPSLSLRIGVITECV
jgi:hypothetical protein